MRRLLIPLFLTVLVAALTPGAATAHSPKTPLCFVKATVERTIQVPPPVAERLVHTTRSYYGACARYGESAALGEGTLTAYSQTWRGKPTAVGLVFPSSTLEGLPYDPPTAGLWCFDRDEDGEIDPYSECAGGYEHALDLAPNESPFTYVLTNWNPTGHIPPGVYDVPHFDIHFYMNANEERLAIRPGPCPQLVNCDDYQLGKNLPDPKYLTEDHQDVDAVEPAMGNHLIDQTGPEFNGEPFTHSFIYGVWDGEVTFYEPMVTHEVFSQLRDGERGDECTALKLPSAWATAGWYPTAYCVRYRGNRDELIVAMEDFVYREAS